MAQPGAWIQQVTGTSLPDAQQKEQWIQNYMAQNRVPRWMAENAWYQQLSPEQQRAVREQWHQNVAQTRAERTAAILDLLMRGEYASAGAAESLLSGDVLGAPGAFWRGLTGKERITYSDIMHERLPEGLPDWAKSSLGFVAGVLLDPTTYLGVGGLTKAGQAARVTGDLAPTLAGRIAAGQQGIVTFAGRTVAPQLQSKVVQALEPLSRRVADSAVVQELVKMFSTKPLGPAAKVEEIIRNKEQVARYLVDRARRQNVELSAVVSELEKQMGLPPGTLERHITREVERMRPATMLRAIRREVKETVPVTETVMRQVEAIRERPRPNPEWYELMQEPVPERLTEQEVIRAITDELAWMRGELEQATVEPGGISRAPDPYHPDVTGSGDVVFRWGTVSTTPPWFRELGRSREEVLQAFERKEGALFERLVEIASRRLQEGYVDWISGTEIPPRFIPERVRETIEVPEQVTRMVERTRQVVEPVEVPWQLTMEYEIQRGDTLSALAKRFNTTVDELLALNPQIRNPDYIRAGDIIRVPNTEAQAATETLRPTHGTARTLPDQVEPDGRISWTRPDVAGVRNVAPTAAASEVPEPQLTPGDRIRVPAPEAVTPIIERIRAEQPARLEREWAAGLPTARWVSEELEYFGRIATPEFEEYLRRNRREFARRERLDIRHASQRPRRLPDLPIEELNRANREGRLGYNRETGEYFVSERTLPRKEQAFPGYNGDLFETDPFVIEYVREARSIRAIKAAEALDEIRELGLREGWIREAPGQLTIEGKVVVDPREIPEGWELLQTPAFGDKFAGLIVRSDIAKHIRGWYEKATNQEQLSWFWKTFDAVQNWWKAMTLSPFPSYHARNLAGNLWNNYLADVAPRYYADAAAALMGRKGSLKIRSGPLAGQSIPYNEVMELAAMHGAIDTGFFAAEFGAARLRDVDQIRLVQAQQAFVRGDWREALRRYRQSVTPRQFILREINPFHPQGLLVRGGRAIGQAIENHARLAHFMDRLARGFTPEQAVASVNTFLFDYRDVTRFEADVMRRLMPFYSWTRKNIPRQILSTAERPGKVVTPLKAERELQRLRGEDMPDPEEIPDWIRESFPVYLGRTEEGEDRWWTALRWWPWAEVFEPIEDPVGWAGGMLTPFLRVPIELATNFDLYFREPIVPPELYAAGETRLRNFLGRPMAAETAHVLGQIRLLSELDRLNPWNVFGEERPYRQDPEQAARWVRFLTGMNIYETDPMMTAIYRRLAELEAIEALRREARRAAREGDEEGLEFILQRIRQRLGR